MDQAGIQDQLLRGDHGAVPFLRDLGLRQGRGRQHLGQDADHALGQALGYDAPRTDAASFIALDRARLGTLYTLQTPAESSAREALVKTVMEQAILPNSSGRASVEAPLHDSLEARFVVHTHPALVNGMTCAVRGREVCHDLFPEALWMDYIDPGYTLCMQVRRQVGQYKQQHGRQPSVIFLKNHGVFVAADRPSDVHALYATVFDRLAGRYEKAGVALKLPVVPQPAAKAVEAAGQQIRQAFGRDMAVAASGAFAFCSRAHLARSHRVLQVVSPDRPSPRRRRFRPIARGSGMIPR